MGKAKGRYNRGERGEAQQHAEIDDRRKVGSRDGALPTQNCVLEQVDATKPSAMSRTSWVNYLVQLGLAATKQQQPDA